MTIVSEACTVDASRSVIGACRVILSSLALTNYCIEGTEMRQLGFKVRRLLFLNRY
jgi:hypothetical protein